MRNKNRHVWRGFKVLGWILLSSLVVGLLVWASWGRDIPVLQPSGVVADYQYTLIMITVGLGVLVVVPVFILLFVIGWKYRAANTTARYEPSLEGNRKLEALWWGIPLIIIVALAIITYVSTHALDPYKKLESSVTAVKVQVVSLDWKWLFIYPEYGIATVNHLTIPKETPINLMLTSDAPMNSFWVPALAGQVYTMTGMSTQLHIMANDTGTYTGSSTNISGRGYADMQFKVYSIEETEFVEWARGAVNSPEQLTTERYAQLAAQSVDNNEMTFMLAQPTLYNDIVNKYMYMDESHGASGERDSHRGGH